MGEIVATIFTTHVPRLMITNLEARKAYMGKNVTTFYDAMPQVERERLHSLEFDTFVLIDSHWFSTLEYILNAHERLAGVYTSEELPQMLHDLEYDYRGDPDLAHAIERSARDRAMRAVASAHRNLPVHYPTLNVMFYFNPDARRRVLSMSVCQTASVDNDLAFGQIVEAAVPSAARNDQAPVKEQLVQRGLRERSLRAPALVIALVVVYVVRAKRPARGDLREDRFRKTALPGIHFSGPRAGATAAVPHRSQEIWPGIERQRREDVGAGQMVLESGALGRRQRTGRGAMKMADEVAFAIPGHAVAEDEVVHPAADVDRVNLGETMVSECGIDTGSRCIEQKRAAVEAAGIER